MIALACYGKTLWARRNFISLYVLDNRIIPRRMLKKAVRQGLGEQRGEAYASYVEPLSAERTPLADFFSLLLE